jgi:hypothetical protein
MRREIWSTIAKNVENPIRILDICFVVLVEKKVAIANRFKDAFLIQ